MSSNMLVIDLIRHGQVDGPAALYGRTDVALSDLGKQQLTQQFANISRPDRLISSPRIRCQQFAQTFSQQCDCPLEIDQSIQEYDFGDWDGIAFDQLKDQWKSIEAFGRAPVDNTPPNGEQFAQFYERIVAFWKKLIEQASPQHYVVLCHGGVIRMIIAEILKLDWRNPRLFSQLNIDYASLTRIVIADVNNAFPVLQVIGMSPDGVVKQTTQSGGEKSE